jgi:PRTRC genetic system ThiF family protein
MMEHVIDTQLLNQRVQVHLIGVGGNGAQIAACLARLDIAMQALGHPFGLYVTAFDADRVSEANVGRQLYSRADIGRLKAVVTINRLNQFYGLDWEAIPSRYEDYWGNNGHRPDGDIVISCVDTRSARRNLHQLLFREYGRCCYWLDLGNREADAQVILGQPPVSYRRRQPEQARLPCVTELFPDLLDENQPDNNRPSCSVRMSLAAQGLFINDVVVRYAVQLLYELFSNGRIRQHGVLVNLDTKRSAPIDIDPCVWRRFGYTPDATTGAEVANLQQVA